MQCQELEQVLEQNEGAPLSAVAAAHLESCGACRSLAADLQTIMSAARQLPAEINPPQRVWISLRSSLVAEGIIQEAAPAAGWLDALRAFFSSPRLATATVGLVIFGAAIAVWQTSPREPSVKFYSVNAAQPALVAAGNVLGAEERGVSGMIQIGDSTVDRSLRDNLAVQDGFIAACERRVREEPDNELAREYLSVAYQQKAQLLATMMDRARGAY